MAATVEATARSLLVGVLAPPLFFEIACYFLLILLITILRITIFEKISINMFLLLRDFTIFQQSEFSPMREVSSVCGTSPLCFQFYRAPPTFRCTPSSILLTKLIQTY